VPNKKEKNSKLKPKTKGQKKSSKPTKKNDSKDQDKQLKELQDKHLRLKAEFENFRRRKADEISRLLQYEGESVIKGFLPILDDLGRMVGSVDSSEESLLDGIELVQSKINKFFENLNVEPFGETGDEMDPIIHDAMLTQADEDKENDIILDVFEKGYTYRDKVIRHAKVIVNKK
tara:strand:- start:2190 stop:2714 length:525 start_codon:yes stop_codon:yes gene_type:complete